MAGRTNSTGSGGGRGSGGRGFTPPRYANYSTMGMIHGDTSGGGGGGGGSGRWRGGRSRGRPPPPPPIHGCRRVDAVHRDSPPASLSEQQATSSTSGRHRYQTRSISATDKSSASGTGCSTDTREPDDKASRSAANFECNICFDMAAEPVVTKCGHLFCWECLYQWLHVHSHHRECPVCKGQVADDAIIPIYGRGGSAASVDNAPPRPTGARVESSRQQQQQQRRRLQLPSIFNRPPSFWELLGDLVESTSQRLQQRSPPPPPPQTFTHPTVLDDDEGHDFETPLVFEATPPDTQYISTRRRQQQQQRSPPLPQTFTHPTVFDDDEGHDFETPLVWEARPPDTQDISTRRRQQQQQRSPPPPQGQDFETPLVFEATPPDTQDISTRRRQQQQRSPPPPQTFTHPTVFDDDEGHDFETPLVWSARPPDTQDISTRRRRRRRRQQQRSSPPLAWEARPPDTQDISTRRRRQQQQQQRSSPPPPPQTFTHPMVFDFEMPLVWSARPPDTHDIDGEDYDDTIDLDDDYEYDYHSMGATLFASSNPNSSQAHAGMINIRDNIVDTATGGYHQQEFGYSGARPHHNNRGRRGRRNRARASANHSSAEQWVHWDTRHFYLQNGGSSNFGAGAAFRPNGGWTERRGRSNLSSNSGGGRGGMQGSRRQRTNYN